MFSESLLEFSAGSSRRGWSTVVAWVLQSLLIASAIVFPLWQTNALPHVVYVETWGPPPGPPPPKTGHQPSHSSAHRQIATTDNAFTAPTSISPVVDMRPDPPRNDVAEGPPCVVCVIGGTGDPNSPGTGVLRNLIPTIAAAPPPPPKPATRLVVSSGVQQGFLVHQVQPVYPAIARAARVEGTVVLAAVINRDGTIQNLHVISGHPMLVPAALDAVKQWRYRPYLLSGQPVEVETQVSVIFTLAH